MSGIDNVISFYRLLNVTALTANISGKVWRYNRPLNSNKVDVVISTPEYIGGAFNKVNVEINIHLPNEVIRVNGADDSTHPYVSELKRVTDIVLSLLSGYDFTVQGKIIRDKDGHWFSNNIIQLESIDPSQGVYAELVELTRLSDNYGGYTASKQTVWSGLVAFTDFKKGSQVNRDDKAFEYIQGNDVIIPYTPQKNMQIETSDGIYTILGIIPESLGLWRVNTFRHDAERN